MASFATVSSFSGLKMQSLRASGVRSSSTSSARPATVVCSSAGNPWEKVGKALVAMGGGLLIATSAHAASVKLGDDKGTLVFEPSAIKVKAGEEIVFTNNKGFPHNVVFDEDEIPKGVSAESISLEDYMNAPNQQYKVTLTVPGTYSVYCEPHQGAGMKATITVE